MICYIYTYGSHERGMGHIYQARALHGALQSLGVETKFLVPDFPEGLNKLREWDLPVTPIPHALDEAEKIALIEQAWGNERPDIVVMDILESTSELMSFFCRKSTCLVSIDDIGPGRKYAHLLVNVIHHPPKIAGATYDELNELNYVVLREDFQRLHDADREVPSRVKKILVSQGGSDTYGGIVELVDVFSDVPNDVEIVLLAGAAFRHAEQLDKALEGVARTFAILSDVSDMAALISTCDLAITGVGKTVFELAAAGVPFIIVTEEPRELETADIVARHVLCDNLGLRSEMSLEKIAHTVEQLLDDMPRRIEMSRSGKAAVDGRGAMRTARAIVDKYKELDQRGRNATER